MRSALREWLDTILPRRFRRASRVVRLSQRPSPYSSSFSVEELDIRLDDGRRLQLILKDLSRDTMLTTGRAIRPDFLYEPRREMQAYRHVLRRRVSGTPLFYGAIADERAGRNWLLLERVMGPELRHVGAFETWHRVAAWLGSFHRHFADRAAALSADPRLHLIRYDREYMWLWMERARRNVERGPARGRASRVEAVRSLAARYRRAIDVLAALPPTIIHGELFASNVIVQAGSRSTRICVLDWETIAAGPGLVDVAALASGQWTDGQRADLLRSYQRALTGGDASVLSKEVLAAFDCSQLHLAIRMIGWPSEQSWQPPADHAQDWLAMAMRIARRRRW